MPGAIPRRSRRFTTTKSTIEVLQNLDLSTLDAADRKIMVGAGITRLVPQTDGAYDAIRDLVKTLNIDLEKLS